MAEPAPLVAIPEAPIPPGGVAEWFVGADGARLRAALFPPTGPGRGSVVLSGGRTEPIEKYFEVIGELQARGFAVLAHDWRGQGLSQRLLPDRLKGHAQSYALFLSDYQALIAAFRSRLPQPWLAFGHSMGGCLTLLALSEPGPQRFAAGVLSAPMLGLRLPIPAWMTAFLADLLCRLGNGDSYATRPGEAQADDRFEDNRLTHDERRFRRSRAQVRACPDLALGGVTWGWLQFALRAMAELARPDRLARVRLPVLLVSAEEDAVVEVAAQARAARRLVNARYLVVPGARHEVLQETDARRAIFWQAFDALADKALPRPDQPRAGA